MWALMAPELRGISSLQLFAPVEFGVSGLTLQL